jgi:two-component system alkaline phosphatase synthesis response regulator PhoP
MGKTANNASATQATEKKKQIVLVVDGRATKQFYTSIFLQRQDYHVVGAKTGEDALQILALTVPRLIITEIKLPEMSGIDLLKHVRQDRRTRKVPVLIYTTQLDPAYREECMQAGCSGYLTYPADLNQLYAAVQKATELPPRNFVRLSKGLDVVVGGGQMAGAERTEKITAVSELGIYVSTENPLPFGAVALFTFFLPTAPDRVISAEGKVQVSHRRGESRKKPGMGVKFKLSGEEQKLIMDFITEKMMEEVAAE